MATATPLATTVNQRRVARVKWVVNTSKRMSSRLLITKAAPHKMPQIQASTQISSVHATGLLAT
jgi:hypothetical protein